MKNSTKIIILSVLGIIGLGLAVAINSIGVSAGVIVVIIAVAIGIITSPTNNRELSQQLTEFEELIQFKRNQMEPMETKGSTEVKINQLATMHESILEQDTKVAGEMVLLADKVRRGHYMCRVASDSKTPHVHLLKKTMNAMLDATEKNLDQAVSVLESLSEGNFSTRAKVDVEGKMALMLEKINTLGAALQSMEQQNNDASESELIGKKHNLLRHPDMAQEIYQNLWMTITEGKPWHGRIKNLTKNKGSYWVDAYIEPIFDNGTIIGYQAVRQNITDETLFESQAKIDSLTGLYNRHSIEEFAQLLIDEAQRYQTPFSIIMVDLDDFKQVNDLYGHSMGDEVLKKISTIFKDLVRSSDRVGRWGGEEFLILLPQATHLQAKELAERLRNGFSSYKFEKIGYKTASFGVALLGDEDTIESLIVKVDTALYNSKKFGKNRIS